MTPRPTTVALDEKRSLGIESLMLPSGLLAHAMRAAWSGGSARSAAGLGGTTGREARGHGLAYRAKGAGSAAKRLQPRDHSP